MSRWLGLHGGRYTGVGSHHHVLDSFLGFGRRESYSDAPGIFEGEWWLFSDNECKQTTKRNIFHDSLPDERIGHKSSSVGVITEYGNWGKGYFNASTNISGYGVTSRASSPRLSRT